MSLILSTLEKGILTVTLNRPEQYNSFTEPMAIALQEVLKEAEKESVRCVVLRAAGKAFCGGQDLNEVRERSKDPDYTLAETVNRSYNPLILRIRNLPKPVICVVQGVAAGAGANLALACDLVIASNRALFVQAFSQIGLIADSGGTWFLPRLAGFGRANALYLLNEKISAQQAVEMGLIWKATEPEQLDQETSAVALKLASMPTKGIALFKKAMNHSFSNSLEQQLHLEAGLQAEAGNSNDFREGVKAFLEKRTPQFKGD
ncbi:MAG: 2-(1,2-epoxy-1,2-dihydrophenyl)acetyl-CoA isomerase [Balneolaceae bacterium]|nr:MAG: 2-(1,2-epoxy-1,2-dihydrophenyl)acetyl-CoA isomerase [Balneolaceae bacterium]